MATCKNNHNKIAYYDDDDCPLCSVLKAKFNSIDNEDVQELFLQIIKGQHRFRTREELHELLDSGLSLAGCR